ncbi:MAG TPA: hypothetical protein VJV78_08625 [Polyangiales bacterium]|nr:hypothetical protein [Polyangiales bacterium]
MSISRASVLTGLFVLTIGSCALPVEETADVVGTGEELSGVLNIDFTGYALGPLGSPWTVNTASAGTLTVASTSDHGNVLKAHFEKYSSLSAETAMVANGPNLDFEFDVKLGAGTAFVLEIKGTRGSAYGSTRTLHFNFVPGGEFSDDQTGVCGKVPVDKWSHVRLLFHTDTPTHVYDAWVDGVQACKDRPFSSTFGFPTKRFGVLNSFLYVFKGDILFDNFKVQTGTP